MAKSTLYSAERIEEYRQKGYWSDDLPVDFWERNAKAFPDKEALVDSKVRLTWEQAKQQKDRIALGLIDMGIQRDEVILAQLPNWVEFYLLRLACEEAGIICAIAPTTLQASEIEFALRHSNAVAVVIPGVFRHFNYFEMIQELRPRLPSLKWVVVVRHEAPAGAVPFNQLSEPPLKQKYSADDLKKRRLLATEISNIYLTSGTTGMPKLVEVLSCHLIFNGKSMLRRFKITGGDIVAALSPITGGPGCTITYYVAAQVGAKIALLERFEAGEAFSFIEREKVTVGGTVPTILNRMANDAHLGDYDCTSLRLLMSAGADIPYTVAMRLEEKIGCRIVNDYGAYDIGNVSQTTADDPPEVRLLTVGKPHPGLEVKLVNEAGEEVPEGEAGEVMIKGPSCQSGFYLNPEATWATWTRDGWGKTGDLAKWDKQGNLVIVGRKKDVIIRGGQNIYPKEIEDLLMQHPRVLTAVIIGMPDPEMGERCCAYVMPKSRETFTFEDMVAFLKEKRIATYKLPERLEFIDSLPMVANQKVDKQALYQDISQKLERENKI